jgi:hypothetical protein
MPLITCSACVYYWFFLDFLGDERELLNAILFRQIHTLQDLSGIVVFRGHVYGIEYMFRMLNISSMFMICQSTDYITHFATCWIKLHLITPVHPLKNQGKINSKHMHGHKIILYVFKSVTILNEFSFVINTVYVKKKIRF